MTVWIVSLEWNQPPSEVTGDTGICGVFTTKEAAEAAAAAERKEYDEDGDSVYQFSMRDDHYCGWCGEETCQCHDREYDDAEFCTACGAELKDTGSCDNDHDEWDIDVHVTEHEVKETA